MNSITIPWPEWTVVRRLGRGGFGTVYEISRTDVFGHEERAALKIISIPQDPQEIRELQLEGNVFHRSPVVAQVHEKHPLAGRTSVTLEDLAPYPHVTYNNENLTGINYCSDIAMYSPANQKKRIVIQDRGALRDIILHTDSYYIGGDYTNFTLLDDHYRRYIPIEGVDFTLNTMWVKQTGRTLTRPEQDFVEVLNEAFAGMPR
jgi:serine/threonine protein kinase